VHLVEELLFKKPFNGSADCRFSPRPEPFEKKPDSLKIFLFFALQTAFCMLKSFFI